MTLTLPLGTFGSVASLFTAILYLENILIGSTTFQVGHHTPYADASGMLLHLTGKFTLGKSCHKVSF